MFKAIMISVVFEVRFLRLWLATIGSVIILLVSMFSRYNGGSRLCGAA